MGLMIVPKKKKKRTHAANQKSMLIKSIGGAIKGAASKLKKKKKPSAKDPPGAGQLPPDLGKDVHKWRHEHMNEAKKLLRDLKIQRKTHPDPSVRAKRYY